MQKKLFSLIFASTIVLAGCSSSPEDQPNDPAADQTQPAASASPTQATSDPTADESTAETTDPAETTAVTGDGTYADPCSIGVTLEDHGWEATIHHVTFDATEAVLNATTYNDPPTEGEEYILVNVTLTCHGDDPAGEMPSLILAYVTDDNRTINTYDNFALAPDALDTLATLHQGDSITGNVALTAPTDTATEGLLSVNTTVLADTVFVKVQ